MLMWEKWTNPKWPQRKGELLSYFKRICNLICTHTQPLAEICTHVSPMWKLLLLHHISATHTRLCLPSPTSVTATVKIFVPAVALVAIQYIAVWTSMSMVAILISRDDEIGTLNLGYQGITRGRLIMFVRTKSVIISFQACFNSWCVWSLCLFSPGFSCHV